MDIFPIWKSTFYETEEDSVKFRILKWGVQEICRATAVRLPDDELLRIGLNKPCQGYLDSNIEVSATGTTISNAYAEFSLQIWNASNSQWFNAYEFAFVNDWSYGEHEETGSFSEPINGHAAPGQLIPYTICSTSTTQETICYDEYDFTAYLTVNPSTIAFDQTGGTATITIFSNTNWYITQMGSLVSLSQYQGGSGTTIVTVTCGENLVIREFTDTLRIRADKRGTTAIEYVHITQEAATPYVRILSGGDAIFDTSGSTWTVVYQTNIPRLYYEMSDGTNTITGYTSGGRVSFNLPPVTGSTSYTLNFYDEPGGTLYATATAEQTIYYFNFYNSDYAAITKDTTAYTVTWDTNYTAVTLVYGSERITTSDTGATFTFPANTGEDEIIHTLYVYNENGRLIGTLHWRQMSILSAQYLTLVATGFTGSATLTLGYARLDSTPMLRQIQYSTDNGSTWNILEAPFNGYDYNEIYLSVSPGDRILFKSAERRGGSLRAKMSKGYCNLEGNYMSLEYGDDFETQTEFGSWTGLNKVIFRDSDIKNANKLVLPASNVPDSMYADFFYGCGILETPPKLYATVVGNGAYSSMFNRCSSLVTAPELPATTIGEAAYLWMFVNCVSLNRTPVLPAIDVPSRAYEGMFSGCINLNRIESYAVSDEYSDYFAKGWAENVAPTGTFIQSPEMRKWLNGPDGNPWYFIPQPVIYTGETGQYNTQYTTLEILTDGDLCFNSVYNLDYETHRNSGAKLFYSINGNDWLAAFDTSSISVNAGDEILLKGLYADRGVAYDYIRWSPSFSGSTAEFNVYGNALSLVFGDWFREETELDGTMACAFSHLFESSKVVSAEDFEMPTGYYPQKAMFEAFRDCPLLTDGPVINCTGYASITFTETFYYCTSLQSIKMPMLANVGSDGFARWVYNVPAGGTFTKHPDAVYPTTAPAQSWIPNGIPDGWTVIDA